MRRLPPLNGLRAFEAAARHLSFSKAAEELFVTPAAISHQIKGLEEYLGLSLFRRMTRNVILTDEAQRVLPLLTEAFDKLADVTEQLKENETSGVLTVSSAPTFAAKWLLPNLDDFTARYPDINVRLDARLDFVDFERDGVDVCVRIGEGRYPGLRVESLFKEHVVPVCHPKFLEGEHALRSPDDLARVPLLHVDWGVKNLVGPSPDWNAWLTLAGAEGVDWKRGPVFTVEGMAIDAAVRGTGIALVSSYSVQEELAKGWLVIPFDQSLNPEIAYWLVTQHRTANQPKIKAFRDWLTNRVKETRDVHR